MPREVGALLEGKLRPRRQSDPVTQSRVTDRWGKIPASQPLSDPEAGVVVQGSEHREVKGKVVSALWL